MDKNKGFFKGTLFGVLFTLCIAGAAAGVGGCKAVRQAAGSQVDLKLERIRDIIDREYLYEEDIDEQAMEEGIYAGYVEALGDPYSVYYDKEQTKELRESTSGEYSGIGAVLSQDYATNAITIINVYKDSPAEKAGLQAGDILYQVDGHVIGEESISEVVTWVKGEEGTEVVLHVQRGEEQLALTAVRGIVQAQTVAGEMKEGQIGYITVSEFDEVTYQQFKDELEDLESQGMQGLVIDLRSNPGGNLDTVVDMLKLILPEGPIVTVKDKGGSVEEYSSDGSHEFAKPLAVLVNQYSASASEIFAGAVQDYGIGKLVGVTTYGKGIVQQLKDLHDGTCLKITVAEYFTPNGRNIHGKGIDPDVEIEYEQKEEDPQADNQLEKALEVVREEIAD